MGLDEPHEYDIASHVILYQNKFSWWSWKTSTSIRFPGVKAPYQINYQN